MCEEELVIYERDTSVHLAAAFPIPTLLVEATRSSLGIVGIESNRVRRPGSSNRPGVFKSEPSEALALIRHGHDHSREA